MKDSMLKKKLVALYEIFYEARRMLVLRTKYRLRIMTWQRTLQYILKNQCSIARFGDGELDLILEKRDLGFQNQSEQIKKDLIKVLSENDPNLLVCISRGLNSTRGCTEHAREFWIQWGKREDHHKEIVDMVRQYTGKNKLFGDTLLTRPYIDWKSSRRAEKCFPLLKQLWEKKDILIVEGTYSCTGVGNDLFSNARSIERIIGPAANAYDRYQELYNAITEHARERLVILALGPTATILAADLSKKGIRALDIGHIDIEYEWYRLGTKERVQIPGKFTNEAKDKDVQEVCTDPVYLDQIIRRIE